MNNCSVFILGTKYEIVFGNEESYPELQGIDGYTDTSCCKIIVDDMKNAEQEEGAKKNLEEYKKQVLRHEILHAFLHESGLDVNKHSSEAWATNEEMIDWFSIQYPKIKYVYDKLGI